MPFRTTGFCVLAVLAGCAAQPQPQPPAQIAQTTPPKPDLSGTILAVRPVPPASVQRVQVLLSGQAQQEDAVPGALLEVIIRTESGSTISVVQPETADLHAGEQVDIAAGKSPHVSVPVIH